MKPKSLPAIFTLLFLLLGIAAPARANPISDAGINGAVIHVTTTEDELNSDGDCSLREAILAANQDSQVDDCAAGSGSVVISLPSGHYILSLPGANEDAGLTGDLDLLSDLTLSGAKADLTVIDGNGIDRVLHVAAAATVKIANLTVQNGSASDSGLFGGGGIFNEKGTLTISKSIIQNNHTELVGGGMDNASTAILIGTIFRDNQAGSSGGGIFNTRMLIVEGSSFTGNIAAENGGGLDNRDTGSVVNSTFSANSAVEDGGGIFNDGEMTLHNVTISENSSGVANASEVRFKNTLVANSTVGENCSGRGTFTSEGHNLDSGNTCNFTAQGDLSGADPSLSPLEAEEGFTPYHPLQPGSQAIDRGYDADCPEVDQRGASRPADGDGDSQRVCDIGAYEFGGSFPSLIYLPLLSR